jgi:DNA replication protein DnaC
LEAATHRLDRFDLLILDDLAYVSKDQAATSVLFELISARAARPQAPPISHSEPGVRFFQILP